MKYFLSFLTLAFSFIVGFKIFKAKTLNNSDTPKYAKGDAVWVL